MGIFNRVSRFGSTMLRKITQPLSATFRYVAKSSQKRPNITNSIEGDGKDTALVAKAVYKPPTERPPIIGSLRLDLEYNGKKHCVYVSDTQQRVIIGLRGTQLDAEDLANDANIVRTDLFDEDNVRFSRSYKVREADELYNRVSSKYPGYQITMTGHSLAGRQVLELARQRRDIGNGNTKYVAFNPGGFPSSVKEYPTDNTQIYLSGSDILSFGFARHPSSIIVDRKDKPLGNNHSIDYFV